ncbi:MAG: hypothetical protein TREMPRED_003198 [Tremellales sp. Tagirdzhanova-0007]|nr:MAG: hypothetical protein TREMPRED_003198 [Tremellales sp. Tagirdzhanova-0007]
MSFGPALPAHLAHLAQDSSRPSSRSPTSDGDDDDDYGPALPPHLAASRQAGSSRPSGPHFPSYPSPSEAQPLTQARSQPQAIEDDESDEEIIGPRPVTRAVGEEEGSAVKEFMEREARWAKEREEASRPKKLERQEWMLVPPTSGVLASVDPLRKRPTTFSRSTKEVNTDSSVWTETPSEKARRIADEVSGIKRKKPIRSGEGAGEDETDRARKRQRDRDILEGVERHNKEQRGASLLDKHAKAKAAGKGEDKEGPVIWDHDRDMGITGRLLSDQERQAKIREARGLNDRFGHSKRGAYDM